jgi:predicted kinase
VPFAIVDCQGDADVLRARISQRRQAGGDPSEADLNVLESQLQAHDELSPAEREFAFGVDIADAASVDRLIADLRVQLGFSAE